MPSKKNLLKKSSVLSKNISLSAIKLKNAAMIIFLVGIVVLLGLARGQFVAANVNGEQITRIELIGQLEKQEGKRILESMVSETLIAQEAKSRKISIAEADIDNEIEKIEASLSAQGQKLDDVIAARGLDRKELREQIRLQLILRKMAGKIEVADQEVNDYIEQNKEAIPENANMDEIKKQAKAQLEQDKLNAKISEMVSELQKKAKIEYFLPL